MAHPEIAGLTDWRPLARGGFATVWQARQETLDRLVAVKVDQRTLDDPKERRRFLREAGAAGRMSGHRGIVTVHDAGILPDGRPFLVMALCPAGSLTSWLKEDRRPSQEEVRDVGIRIADALAAAHSNGVLHRDVKPANILIDPYGEPGLADFGLAAMPQPGQDPSVTMEALTPAYAPREVLYQKPPSEYGDVYSLAATLYALLGGKPPRWPDSGTPSLPEIFELQSHPIEPLPHVDPRLMNVLLAALADEPADRPTAAEFRDRLEAVDLSAPAPTPPPPDPPARPVTTGPDRRRRSRFAILIAAVAALLVGAVAVGMALAGNRTPTAQPTANVTAGPSSRSASPSPSQSSDSPSPSTDPTPPPPPGFVGCSELVGVDGAFCPTKPECWYQYISNNDFPAVASAIACDQSHTNETFAGGRIPFVPRLQSELERDATVQSICNRAVASKVVAPGVKVTSGWSIDPFPPQLGQTDMFFRCFFVTGASRTEPVPLRTF